MSIFNKPRLLIGVLACHHRAPHLSVCRETWIPATKNICDYKFFFGRGSHENPQADEVTLDCDDAYRGLACKVQEVCRWALSQGYEYLFKADDDTYVRPERVMHADFEGYDLVGRKHGKTDRYHGCDYPRGGSGYYLSRRAMQVVADYHTPNPDDPSEYAEDAFIGKVMLQAGIECHDNPNLRVAEMSGPGRTPRPNGFQGWKKDCPTQYNTFITVCEFLGSEMYGPHKEWTQSMDKHSALMGKLRVR